MRLLPHRPPRRRRISPDAAGLNSYLWPGAAQVGVPGALGLTRRGVQLHMLLLVGIVAGHDCNGRLAGAEVYRHVGEARWDE